MKKVNRFLVALALGLFFVGIAAADTLELKDGRVLKGKYLGGTQAVLRFEINGEVGTFCTTELVALAFNGGSGSAAPMSDPAPVGEPARRMAAPSAASSAPRGAITIPAGETMLVRMIDGVDSSKNHVGDVFHAGLETDLTIGDTVVARKGTDVYGRLAEAKEAGHIAGSSELRLELTRIVIHGRWYRALPAEVREKPRKRRATARLFLSAHAYSCQRVVLAISRASIGLEPRAGNSLLPLLLLVSKLPPQAGRPCLKKNLE